ETERYSILFIVFAACMIGFVIHYRFVYLQVIKPIEEDAKSKGSFLAKMSHEIRTPLNAIINMGEFMENPSLKMAEQKQYLEILNKSAKHLHGVVDEILDFSKIEAGEIQLELIPFDATDLVRTCTGIFVGETTKKGIALNVTIPPDIPAKLMGDPQRLRQVLLNLISNAVKFTEKGEILVVVKLAENGLNFTISDTGVGIGVDRQASVFEEFSQADNSISRTHGGTGLGLTISKNLVELMGGKMALTSRLGEGTSVSFYLPLEPANGRAVEEEAVLENELFLQGKTVLLVEDNQVNQMVAKAILSKWGASVQVADHGQAAIDYIEAHTMPDIILMDFHMPVMNGLQATEILRKKGVTIPIIALSAAALEQETKLCFAAGMDDFIAKPLNQRDLKVMLLKWINQTNN
ncbi:MAG: response regulator, partial [Kordiimonadaceae bacterium]|nr:response regulator [Kordiimonadaceae bacterium]